MRNLIKRHLILKFNLSLEFLEGGFLEQTQVISLIKEDLKCLYLNKKLGINQSILKAVKWTFLMKCSGIGEDRSICQEVIIRIDFDCIIYAIYLIYEQFD